MQREGFFWADRTIDVTIRLDKVVQDLKHLQRFPTAETADYKEDIFRVAQESFVQDRRFHVAPDCDPRVSAVVLRRWVDELGSSLVTVVNGRLVGFLNLRENLSDGSCEVRLAAVDARYRMSCAAMGLYARAIELARERGFKKLIGRISSLNASVMSLYASFGAQFSNPHDVFLREI